jgi:hypothetical protein
MRRTRLQLDGRYSSRPATTGQNRGFRSGSGCTPAGPSWGAVGEGDVHDFTALGDTVNTAARLTDVADAGEILISSDAAAAGGLDTTGLERRTLELRGTLTGQPVSGT